MPRFKITYVREQGVDLIIVPLDHSFGSKVAWEQQSIASELQSHAQGAGLAGTVVTVWDSGEGRMGFLAPLKTGITFSSLRV